MKRIVTLTLVILLVAPASVACGNGGESAEPPVTCPQYSCSYIEGALCPVYSMAEVENIVHGLHYSDETDYIWERCYQVTATYWGDGIWKVTVEPSCPGRTMKTWTILDPIYEKCP